MKKDHY